MNSANGATLATLPYGAAVNPFDGSCGLPPSRSTETATGPPS